MSPPSPPAGCLSSRPGKRITTRGTNGVVGAVALHPSVVRAPAAGGRRTHSPSPRADASAMKLRCFLAACARTIAATVHGGPRRVDAVGIRPSVRLRAPGVRDVWGRGQSSTSGTRRHRRRAVVSSGPPDPREAGRHRTFPTPGDHRGSPATANLGGSHHRTPGVRIPSLARLRALQFVLGCFQLAYGGPGCLDERMVGVGTRGLSGLDDLR